MQTERLGRIKSTQIIHPKTGIHPKKSPTKVLNNTQYQFSERRARPSNVAYFPKHALIAPVNPIMKCFIYCP